MTEYEGAIGAGASGPEGSVYQPPGTMPTGPIQGPMQGPIITQPGSPWNGSIYTDDDNDDETVDEPIPVGGVFIPKPWNGWDGGGPIGPIFGGTTTPQMSYGSGFGIQNPGYHNPGTHNPGYHNPGMQNPGYYSPCSCYYFGRHVTWY
ncbi:hypothetical protein [Peribacillus frigoritolerans]|uniref:hypothetical protein n=1 Tax=Peribacillus castrilensis TaxID=2897690 RepID=UPI002DD03AE2|nr:hypothetical protein [Peribacillus castrilensis]